MMEQLIRISISDLTELLEKHVMTTGMLTLKVAPTRLTCNIDGCIWQISDAIELDSHRQERHGDRAGNIDPGMLQIVLSEIELQKLAAEGRATIGGNSFEIVHPVRFLFSIHGGRWYTEGIDRIYDTETQFSAKEAQLQGELQELRSTHVQELAKRDESARAEQEVNKSAHSRIKQLEREIAEINATFEDKEGDDSALSTPNDENSSQGLVNSDAHAAQNTNATKLTSPADLRRKISREIANIMKEVMEHLKENQTKQNAIIHTQSNQIAAQLQQISGYKKEIGVKNTIIEAILPVYQRFFVRAERSYPKLTTQDSAREARQKQTISKGNDAAHRANFIAHVCLWNDKRLNSTDTGTFEKIYGFHPKKYDSMLRPSNLVEMYDMMGTIAAIPYRLKYGDSAYAAKYEDFIAHAAAVAKIRDTFKREVGKEEEASANCGSDPDLLDNLQKMRVIYAQFIEYDKTDRERYFDN